MMGKPKLNEILLAIALAAFGILALVVSLLFVLQLAAGLGGTQESATGRLALAAGAALICAVIFEAATQRLRQALALNQAKISTDDTTIYRQIAGVTQYTDLAKGCLGLGVVLILIGVAVDLVLHSPLRTSTELIVYLATFLVYLVVRRPLFTKLTRLAAAVSSQYAVTASGLTISRMSGMRRGQAPVAIGFDEIDEIKVFTPAEAQAYMRYEVGPNLDLAAKEMSDRVAFTTGRIPRPSVYTFGWENTIGTTILIRGPSLFYLTNFSGHDGTDLLRAFTEYRQHRAAEGN